MATRRDIISQFVDRVRDQRVPPVDVSETSPTTSRAEELIEAHLTDGLAAIRADRYQQWLELPEQFPRGLDGADASESIACLLLVLDRLEDAYRRPIDEQRVQLLWLAAAHLIARKLPNSPGDVVRLLDLAASLIAALPTPQNGTVHRAEVSTLSKLISGVATLTVAHGADPDIRAAAGRFLTAMASASAVKRIRGERDGHANRWANPNEATGPEGVLDDRDPWGGHVCGALRPLEPAEWVEWRPLLAHAATARGARPTNAWQRAAERLLAAIEADAFTRTVIEWLGWYAALPLRTDVDPRMTPDDPCGMAERNLELLRGLIWCFAKRDDVAIAAALGDVAEASFKKIPGVGPRSIKLGNACVYALGAMPGMRGVEAMARVRQRVIYGQARTAIDRALDAAAGRLGLAREDLDDLATPTYGLVNGRRRFAFSPFAAEVAIDGAAGFEVRWFGPDGAARRTEPAEVRQRFPDERAAMKRVADEVRKALPAQRARLEQLLLADRFWPLPVWRERYLDHPLLAHFSRRLIWTFTHDERNEAGMWRGGAIVDAADRQLESLPPETRVQLWHPVRADEASIAAWQIALERHEIRQPFKQAHREIYVLTDAERTTETYSNRFAAHILRQPQLHALAQQRGWSFSYLPWSSDGRNGPTLELPGWGLAAELFVEEVDDGETTDTGICTYVATDQVRFRRLGRRAGLHDRYGDVVSLADVPPHVFTEVLRDVDLFVGVASVGADPNWRDRGPRRIREYWEGYAFGELNESAKTRRALLERLIPRLAIAPRCALEERFLVVKGDLRMYRIHLGSGNITMEPNNQYLCIVPKRAGNDLGTDLFLPFEGDGIMATILSKAFLLADDRAISDPTITRQIGRSIT